MRLSTGRAIAVIAAATMIGLAGCASDSGDPRPSEDGAMVQEGGVLQVASLSEMPGFDPVRLVAAGSGIERAAAVMDTLLFRDEVTDEVFPKLAAGIESDDGVVWVLSLREGVEFTDGTPLNADAVVYNLERHVAEDSTSRAKPMLSGVETFEATGEYEVTITLREPNGSFPLALTGSSPAGLVGSPSALEDPETFNRNPVGAGPFVVESWVVDDKLTLVKNENYWDEGKPYLDGVVFSVMGDQQTRADALTSGSIDVALITAPMWNVMNQNSDLRLYRITTGGEVLVPNATRGPGQDKRVRQAISLALDGKTMAQVLAGGTQLWDGSTECIPFSPGAPACAPGTASEFDPDRAKELVHEYLDEGGDPSITLTYARSQVQALAEYIQQALGATGLQVSLNAMDIGSYSEAQASGDYELIWGSTASAGFPTVWTRMYSGGSNWGQVAYEELDEALLRARDALELDDRNAAWRDVAGIIKENAVLTWTNPYPGAMTASAVAHLGSEDHPYAGSTMLYLDSAWLEG